MGYLIVVLSSIGLVCTLGIIFCAPSDVHYPTPDVPLPSEPKEYKVSVFYDKIGETWRWTIYGTLLCCRADTEELARKAVAEEILRREEQRTRKALKPEVWTKSDAKSFLGV